MSVFGPDGPLVLVAHVDAYEVFRRRPGQGRRHHPLIVTLAETGEVL